MAKSRLHAMVSGRVQGVGFRYFVGEHARDLGVDGWVRNTYDHEVEVVAEGERAQLEILLEHLRRGPRLSRVDDVDATWSEARDEFNAFRVTG